MQIAVFHILAYLLEKKCLKKVLSSFHSALALCKQKTNKNVEHEKKNEEKKHTDKIIKSKSSFCFLYFILITQIIHSLPIENHWLNVHCEFECFFSLWLHFLSTFDFMHSFVFRSLICFFFVRFLLLFHSDEITSNKSAIHKLYDNGMKCR